MPSTESTHSALARLSFWVPAERLAKFEAAYRAKLMPLLKQHGLVESAQRGRKTVAGVFSRLFEVEGPAEVVAKKEALEADPDWQGALQELDTALGILGKGPQRAQQTAGFYFSPYQTPAGPGATVSAGPGRQVAAGRGRGHWRTFDATDGLPGGIIRAILQDREGYLWIGSWGGGLSRYDGHRFQPFTSQEGLASRLVQSVIEDREGNLWIGTIDKGLFCYDGQRFEHFTTQDGLVADEVMRVFQDREGHIWVGTLKGLSRYDGHRFENFTAQEGLPGDSVQAIFQDQEGYLWFGIGELGGEGRRGGVSRYDGHRFQTFTTQEGLAFDAVWSILQDREGIFWFGTGGGVSRYDGHRFQTFTTEDGLAANNVWSILQDQEGDLWFGTKGGGVSRYDGRTFTTFTSQDGLGDNSLEAIFQDREGSLWFGTWGGLSRYDNQLSTTFTAEDGLADDEVLAILQDREGVFWFGTRGGLSRYDGRSFTTFTAQDGLAANGVRRIFQDREGNLWFGHGSDQVSGKGLTRYDGHCFTVFSDQDGLGSDRVYAILQDQAGNLWFGGGGGVSRYDGSRFEYFAAADGLSTNWVGSIVQDQEGVLWFGSGMGLSRYDGHTFTTQDGLADKWVNSICQAQGGGLWLGTQGGGVLRYDGQSVKSFTTRDGLADDSVDSVLCDLQGRTWFGTSGGGVSLYDGQIFQTFTTQEGLGANAVRIILQDREGNLWFGTTQGVTRFRPAPPSSPPIYIDAVVADRRYEGEAEITTPVSVKLLAFEFHSISFKTRPEAMIFRYRLEGYEEIWQNTHSRRVEYQDLPLGEYTFQVRAVDRDLNYSEPTEVRLKVIPDPRDQRIDELEERVRERTQELEATHQRLQETQAQLIAELEDELQTAHELQMGLMPSKSPQIPGLDLAGRCVPANHVGGDFFQYFAQEGKVAIALADVTGHAMEAAIPMVMFSGILETEMQYGRSLEHLLSSLNRTLNRKLDHHTLVCFCMGEWEPARQSFRFSNSGCPYPYHFRAATGEVSELRVDAYPLGVRPDTTYQAKEVQLAPGDRVVFCSDGIIEAANAAGELFGFERTAATIRKGCLEGLSAEALLARIMAEVKGFRGEAPQGDDQTVVVLKVAPSPDSIRQSARR